MSKSNNGQNQLPSRPQTKAEIVAQREQVRMLGIALGNWREAARQCGLFEETLSGQQLLSVNGSWP